MPMSDAAEEQAHFLLMLGKPGGGKGTISKKILKVRKKKDERKHSWNIREWTAVLVFYLNLNRFLYVRAW